MKHAVKIFKALSDPTRLRILMLLLKRDLCVCELVFSLKMEQSRISHQLRILRDADLVESIREGRWTNYRIPERTKQNLKKLIDLMVKEDFLESGELVEDRKDLEKCLKENIRMRKCV